MINYEALAKHRANLKKELKDLLKSNQRVACVQPTGMGKSHIIAELCQEFKGKKLVLEPGNSIINYMEQFDIETPNTDYITYHSLLRPDIQDIVRKFKDYDYIFLDEMHRALAETWGTKLMDVLSSLDKITTYKLIGFSATPIRSDNRDAVEEIFNNIQTKPYYLADAILDNLLPNIDYHNSIYEITNEQKEKLIQKDTPIAKAILSYDIEEGVSNIISKVVDLSKNHKIICFVDKINNIPEAIYNIKRWFKIDVNIFEIHSGNAQRKNNKILEEFQTKEGINILFTVNILNEGVHVPGVDTVIFLRKTRSNIVYNQQLGRVMSDFNENPIVLDLVNNSENLDWGYSMIFKDKSNDLKIPIKKLTCVNGDSLMITTHQTDIINNLINIFKAVPKITSEMVEYFKNHEGKLTCKELATKFGLKVETVRSYCLNHNIKYKLQTAKKITSEIAEFLEKHNGEFTCSYLISKFGLNKATLRSYCKAHNIKLVTVSHIFTDKVIQFIKDNEGKFTAEELADELKINESTLRNYINRNFKDYKFKPGHQTYFNDTVIEFLTNNSKNYTIRELHELLCIPISTLEAYIRKNKLEYKKIRKNKITSEIDNYLRNHCNEFTLCDFTKILNISRATLAYHCRKNNIICKKDFRGARKTIENNKREVVDELKNI